MSETADEVSETADTVETYRDDQNGPEIDPVPPIERVLEEQWKVGLRKDADGKAGKWVAYRVPVLVRETPEVEKVPAVHEPGHVASIELVRDPEKKRPTLRITGVMNSENANCDIVEVELFRSEDDGDPQAVPGFSAKSDFVFVDDTVERGKTYSYFFVSKARSTDDDIHPLAAADQMSAVLGPTPGHPARLLLGRAPRRQQLDAAVGLGQAGHVRLRLG